MEIAGVKELKALDGLLETKLDVSKLESIAASIGSDVPFFIRGVPAICRGRGEVLEPVSGVSTYSATTPPAPSIRHSRPTRRRPA
jgi:4-diphosphocytidyl-2-C-methyl-D-erythritol kinase